MGDWINRSILLAAFIILTGCSGNITTKGSVVDVNLTFTAINSSDGLLVVQLTPLTHIGNLSGYINISDNIEVVSGKKEWKFEDMYTYSRPTYNLTIHRNRAEQAKVTVYVNGSETSAKLTI